MAENMKKKKSSTLIIATRSPGTCGTCRHVNAGTADFAEGRPLCWMDRQPKRMDQRCDVTRSLPRSTAMQDPSVWGLYYLYEKRDASNGTFEKSEDLRILAEDADEKLRNSLEARLPMLEG